MEQGGMMLGHAVNNSIVIFRGVCCPSALCNRNMTLGEVQIYSYSWISNAAFECRDIVWFSNPTRYDM